MNPNIGPGEHYTVDLWGSHPDRGNDDCWTGVGAETLAAAVRLLEGVAEWASWTDLRAAAWIIIMDAEGNVVRERRNPDFDRSRDNGDDEWRRERAMQAGMAFGVAGYNDEMGY
jgi:hypothetical protein